MSEDLYIVSGAGIRLLTTYHRAPDPVASVLIIHGLSDHSGRYAHISAHLASQDISSMRFDFRGFGRSDGKPGQINRFSDYVEDLASAIKHFQRQSGDLPMFAIAQSMGALVLATYCLAYKNIFRGVVSASGLFKVNEDLSPILRKFSGIVSLLLPTLKTVGLDLFGLSRDPQVAITVKADKLHYTDGIRARTAAEVIKATARMQERLGEVDYPLLLLHGEEDPITKAESSKLIYDLSISDDKTLHIFPGARHELFFELNKQEVLMIVVDWIKARI